MALSLNRVTLIGNLGRDPEIRSTQDGKEIASFSIATSDSWRDKDSGERRERTEWHKVVIFAQPLVNIVKNYVHKGSKLYVEGSLHTRKWQDQAGVERQTTEVVIQSYNGTIMMLEGRPSGGGKGDDMHRDPMSVGDKSDHNFEVERLDDEIPF
ncbi:MAG: single-strand DNA-binding protein [Candidatus Midichloriaceae bacterium]|jgi:single-strand DNA-binding protein|nr:single-strand DNA-binding protein [Candidatus Midichloriaceae bacterium]